MPEVEEYLHRKFDKTVERIVRVPKEDLDLVRSCFKGSFLIFLLCHVNGSGDVLVKQLSASNTLTRTQPSIKQLSQITCLDTEGHS